MKSHVLYRLLCLSIVVDEASLWKRSARQLGNRPRWFFPGLPPLWLMLSLASHLVIFPALPCDLLPRLAPHDFFNRASLWFLPCAPYLDFSHASLWFSFSLTPDDIFSHVCYFPGSWHWSLVNNFGQVFFPLVSYSPLKFLILFFSNSIFVYFVISLDLFGLCRCLDCMKLRWPDVILSLLC